MSDAGRRGAARSRLEFDHVRPVARSGEATASNLRLLCRTHNRHEAARVLGAGVVERRRSPVARPVHDALASARARAVEEVIPWLRQLGFRKDEARQAAALCAETLDAPLEIRVRAALRHLGRSLTRRPSGFGERPPLLTAGAAPGT